MPGAGSPSRKAGAATRPERPRAPRKRTTSALEALPEGEAEGITRKAIELAQNGDTVALRLCMDRLIPVWKDRPVRFEMPEIATTADLPQATSALLQAVAAGDLTPSEAADIGRAVDAHVMAIETSELAARLARLEEGQGA